MYIVDFFKRIARKSNITVLIYLILNVLIIGLVISLLFEMNFFLALLIGIAVYALSLLIALSPFGEWILRKQTGCKKIKRKEQIDFLEPIYREVYNKAKALDPSIPEDVQLYMNNDEEPNAFATGRKTVCVTRGLLDMPVDQIKATLGHEFGHLAHKDTDLILVVSVGNLIVNVIILGVRIIITILGFILDISVGRIAGTVSNVLLTAIVGGLMWLWTKLGMVLVMKSSRDNEFEADEFSFNLGYGNELCELLDSIGDSKAKGLFANLASSHPDKDDRIAALQSLGATYRASYGK